MNLRELSERQAAATEGVMNRFLADGTRSVQVQRQIRQKAAAAVEARQIEEFERALEAEIETMMQAPEADETEEVNK